jgi:Sulfotransferase family
MGCARSRGPGSPRSEANTLTKFATAKEIAFVHIPKTAGTSFTDYLETGLHHAGTQCLTDPWCARKILLSGHEYLSDLYPRVHHGYFITILRDPISRTVSQYRSLRNASNYHPGWRDQWSREQVAALEFCHQATFEEFIHCCDETVLGHIVNVQTRMLADHKIDAITLLDSRSLRESLLKSARHNIVQKIDFVAIYELINTSLMMFKRESGFRGDLAHRNMSERYDVRIGARELARLHELLELDFQLYEFALKVFDARVSAAFAT